MEVGEELMKRVDAVRGFILKSTVPIMVEIEDNKPVPVGTGNLLRINDRHFIVTAAHLFMDNPSHLEHVAIPDSRQTSGYTRILNMQYTRPRNQHVDVAVMEIIHPDSVSALKDNWNFLTLDNVRVSVNPPGGGWLVGFPRSEYDVDGKTMIFKPITVMTALLPSVPKGAEQPVLEGLDWFYEYSRIADVVGKSFTTTPNLEGASGAAFWDVSGQPEQGFWAPEGFAKIVGVQSSSMHGAYMRVKSWWAVARTLAKLDDELAKAVFDKLGVAPGPTSAQAGTTELGEQADPIG
ncbi:hypothetical protein [Mesorhizobium sp. M0040]|uniref:hypothetical protein n=1 Tax=Mesorhizobium sp. M0040 TaxID=2956855 RepID=UPI00333594E4